jgi:ankyrin repeat protein
MLTLGSASADDIHTRWISAISNDRTDTLQILLNTAATKPDLIAVAAANGKDALMVACKQGDLALAKQLVAAGTDINRVTLTGGTPFMFAVLGDQQAVAEWLHAQGVAVNAKGSNGWSAMTIAAAKGLDKILAWLIANEADINSADVYGFTPLMRAVDNNHLLAATVLLSTAGIDVNHGDESDNTALHYAVANGKVRMVELLLQHGARRTIKNRDGLSPEAMASGVAGMQAAFARSH